MSNIHIKLLSDSALAYIKKNIEKVTSLIQNNETNDWINTVFTEPVFVEKKYTIPDFELKENPYFQSDADIDFENSITLYEALNCLPIYILTDERFWLWLYFDKFYSIVRTMMQIKSSTTIKDHWLFGQGIRRGLMFGVLSRCYYRVLLSVDNNTNNRDNKYELTKWVIEFPERFRNMTWRSFSSEPHLVRGILRAEKRAVAEKGIEHSSFYQELVKYVLQVGSVCLLDAFEEKDIEDLAYKKMIALYEEKEAK